MSTILDTIVEKTKEDLVKQKRRVTARDLESMECYESPRRGFRRSLRQDTLSVIAEVKKASPSRGVIRSDFDPLKIAGSYVNGGASALSVLTDKPFFKGDLTYLEKISKNYHIPLLRKDFIVDPYQVSEARAYGADAILLVVSITNGNQLEELLHAAFEMGLDALVECYSAEEVGQLDWERVDLLGVNNRDLRTFEVNLHRGVELLCKSPENTVRVSESGLSTSSDLKYLVDHEIDAALIGEHFMRQADPGGALRQVLEELRTIVESEKRRDEQYE